MFMTAEIRIWSNILFLKGNCWVWGKKSIGVRQKKKHKKTNSGLFISFSPNATKWTSIWNGFWNPICCSPLLQLTLYANLSVPASDNESGRTDPRSRKKRQDKRFRKWDQDEIRLGETQAGRLREKRKEWVECLSWISKVNEPRTGGKSLHSA